MSDPKTHLDPEEPGSFVTEDDDGTIREATPEEIEETIKQWEQWENDASSNES
ncbi:hypothetical protein I8752_13805 [Nostocaceae cyanobacterium CENA369]|uniref:Uncharacterized protein n=1 Tax=Dendronalium phyllosphericum CENA369 TaxID=1725256 RepID=A0A8J7LHJ0_9NOST|nr:hypothetical protein [Dendronalium phyllosphericum]MBH8574074.1 hypothetical protein [Dendronalium phyllosphericum CENA369]